MTDKQLKRWNILVEDCRCASFSKINVGGQFVRSVIVAVDNVLRTKKHSDTDLCEFSEWCSRNGWLYANYSKLWTNIGGVQKTTSQLREMWEVETGRG